MIFVTPGTITGQGIVLCLNPGTFCTRKQTDSCVVIPAALLAEVKMIRG